MLKYNGQYESHLVISNSAKRTMELETELHLEDMISLADIVYDIDDIGASIASGTFRIDGMVVVPCSMKTVAGIACGYAENLLLRAADVTIKERKKLVLVVRESPLSQIHLKNMLYLAEMGVVITPPLVAYYNKPKSLEEVSKQIACRILDNFGIELNDYKRWGS